MNEKKIFESQEATIENLRTDSIKHTDSLEMLKGKIHDLNYFTLQGNENAMTYFEQRGFEAAEVEASVSDQIYDYNLNSGNNSLVPFEGMNGPMKINKVKFLNHKWIQVDFTDGKFWGEMILEFYFNEKNELQLKPISSFLYPN